MISVAFTTRWYSTVPVPMLRSRRDLVAERATSQTDRDGRAERQVVEVGLRGRGTEPARLEAHELGDEQRDDDEAAASVDREGEDEAMPPPELARLRGDALPDGGRAFQQPIGRPADDRDRLSFAGQRSVPPRTSAARRGRGGSEAARPSCPAEWYWVVQAVVA